MKEFDLINRYFSGRGVTRRDVNLGIGDDCALVSPPEKSQIAITTDTLVAGVHFFADMPAKALGHRALAVNLSDLAAMGAEPAWVTVAMTLPEVDEQWVADFSDGLHDAAEYYNVQVIGGDTTQGPLTITIGAHGLVPQGKGLTRSGAKVGDWIYVTGTLGDASAAIAQLAGKTTFSDEQFAEFQSRFYTPTPRVAAGQMLRGAATAAIDVSDGLLSDLGHILKRSEVGARIHCEHLPASESLKAALDIEARLPYQLAGGDDYEILFTVPEDKKGMVEVNLRQYGVAVSCIGQIIGGEGKIELYLNGEKRDTAQFRGFEHFAEDSE